MLLFIFLTVDPVARIVFVTTVVFATIVAVVVLVVTIVVIVVAFVVVVVVVAVATVDNCNCEKFTYTRTNAEIVTDLLTTCNKVYSSRHPRLCSHYLFPVVVTSLEQVVLLFSAF